MIDISVASVCSDSRITTDCEVIISYSDTFPCLVDCNIVKCFWMFLQIAQFDHPSSSGKSFGRPGGRTLPTSVTGALEVVRRSWLYPDTLSLLCVKWHNISLSFWLKKKFSIFQSPNRNTSLSWHPCFPHFLPHSSHECLFTDVFERWPLSFWFEMFTVLSYFMVFLSPFSQVWEDYTSNKAKRGFSYIKNGVFWVVTPCGSCKNRRFEGTWRLLHQGDKNRWTRNNVSCN
jgi:hypothetical protein